MSNAVFAAGIDTSSLDRASSYPVVGDLVSAAVDTTTGSINGHQTSARASAPAKMVNGVNASSPDQSHTSTTVFVANGSAAADSGGKTIKSTASEPNINGHTNGKVDDSRGSFHRAGGRLAAFVQNTTTRLVAASSYGRIAEVTVSLSGAARSLICASEAGTLDCSSHPLSRVCIVKSSCESMLLLYQAGDGSIVQRQSGIEDKEWSSEQVVVPGGDTRLSPLSGTTLTTFTAASGPVLIWQTKQGSLARTELAYMTTTLIDGVTAPRGTHITATCSTDARTLSLFWVDDAARTIRKAVGASSPSMIGFDVQPIIQDWQIRTPMASLAVLPGLGGSDKSMLFYFVDGDGICSEMDGGGQVRQRLSSSNKRANVSAGIAVAATISANQATSEPRAVASQIFYFDEELGQVVMLCRDPNGHLTEEIALEGTETWSHYSGSLMGEIAADEAVFAGPNYGEAGSVPVSQEGAASTTVGAWVRKTCQDVIVPQLKKTATAGGDLIQRRAGPTDEAGEDSKHLVHAVLANRDKLWSSNPQDIRYFFMGGTPQQRQKVADTIEEWTYYANVRFVEVSSPEQSQVRITFNPNTGSYSYVGTDCEHIATDKHTMNLAWLDPTSKRTRRERAVVLHEFGHVLGLLHEHQSPAHGGVAVKNVELAKQVYRESQGWTDEEIESQVIRVYRDKEVSNYSSVDPTSIMHYPQSAELTGLNHDIEYNYDLSPLDKAYMVLQYPRASPHPDAPEWTLQHALGVAGCPKAVADKILASAKAHRQPNSDEIDPTEMRKIIGAWTRESHKHLDTVPPTSEIGRSDGPARGVDGANVDEIPNLFKESGRKDLTLIDAGENQDTYGMCATDSSRSNRTATDPDSARRGGPAVEHAVVNQEWLLPLAPDNDISKVTIRYKFSPKYAQPSDYQKGLFQRACEDWQKYAHVHFVLEVNSSKEPDLMVVIHRNNTLGETNNSLYSYDIEPMSRVRSLVRLPSGGRSFEATRRRRNSPEHLDSCTIPGRDGQPDLFHPRVPWDICYYGIFKEEADSEEWTSKSGLDVSGLELNMRSLRHELVHWLGLHHENVGMYSAWINDYRLNERKKVAEAAKRLHATKYDTCSVMDCIGLSLSRTAERLLDEKGFKGVSLAGFRRSTVSGWLVRRVNVSVNLSQYDKANIILLYPSPKILVEKCTLTFLDRPWTLRRKADGRSILGALLDILQIKQDSASLVEHLEQGRWGQAREEYLRMLRKRQDEEYEAIQQFIASLASQVVVRVVPIPPSQKSGEKMEEVVNKYDVTLDISDEFDPSRTIYRDIGGKDKEAGPPASEGPFIKTIYRKLTEFFPPGDGQYFALQFPTRFLDKESYAYDTSGVFSRFEKPVVVNESEFRLTDALYPLGPIVSGPNGQSLSSNYLKALNSLVPSYDGGDARKQREKMRTWLLTQTDTDNAAYTVDTRLTMPGLDADSAHQLSSTTGVRVSAVDKVTTDGSGPISRGSGSAPGPSVAHAQKALSGVKEEGLFRPRPMTRMEFADSLTQDYLDTRMRWELHRDEMISSAEKEEDPKALEAVTRKLARITNVENAKLASKYADAVVRGHSHTVRELMGHLDVRTTAEFLQDAKDSLRESALSSLYTASNVYPVQMEPADWFLALDTGFTSEDLSQAPELMQASIEAKASQVDNLQTQIANLRGFATVDPKEAQAKVKEAAKAKDEALMKLNGAYTASTITAIKLVLEAAASTTPVGAASVGIAAMAESTLKAVKAKPDTDEDKSKLKKLLGEDFEKVDEIGKQMDTVTKANNEVNARSRELAELMSQAALAEAGDTRTMVENLQRKLAAVQAELHDLTESYGLSRRAKLKKDEDSAKTAAEVGALPPGGSTGGGGTRWMELSLCSEVENSTTSTESMAHASSTDWSCNFWIGSYAKSSSEASASNATKTKKSTFKVDMSMRVTYVTVDRAGWFDPSLFSISSSFMHSVPDIDYTPWAKWNAKETTTKKVGGKDVQVEGPASPRYIANKIVTDGIKSDADGSTERTVEGYFTHFPAGYVLVKDCVIRVYTSDYSSEDAKSNFQKSSSESGGFLCFSHSNSSSDSGNSSSSASTFTKDGVVIRIPGPQILGYIMQLISPDQTKTFRTMPDDYLFDEMDRIDREGKVSHGIDPLATVNEGTSSSKTSGVRQYSVGPDRRRRGSDAGKGSKPADMGNRPAAMVNGQQPAPAKFEDKLREAVDAAPGLKERSAEDRSEILKLIEKLLAPSK